MENNIKPKLILNLEKELGVEVDNFKIDSNGEIYSLKINKKGLTNIEPIKKIKTLQVLSLHSNEIDNINPLKELVKLESEEAVKWGTKKILDSQTIHDVFKSVVHGFTNMQHNFVDYIRPENFG